MKRVRIGNGCGFWGDNVDAPILLAESGHLDYLTLEYLAELTMSILALQKQKNPHAGFAADFLDVLTRLLPTLESQSSLRIVSNAGGMNPLVCAERARAILDDFGLQKRKIAIVTGDDIAPKLDELIRQGHTLDHLDTGRPLADVLDRVVSANAYLGAHPIADALVGGADLVITGRVADASLTVGAAVHEFGWSWQDWDKLASATVAGHLIECGAQATGGLWCNWPEAPALENVGYPIAEISANGDLVITKPMDSGGAVNIETVAEQLLYEVGDPAAYLTPDVVADFTSVTLNSENKDVVAVRGSRGRTSPDKYKVSIAYRDGFTASGMIVVYGPEASAKARRCGAMVLDRLRRSGFSYDRSNVEVLGTGECAPESGTASLSPPEVVLRISVRDRNKAAVDRFTKELAPLVTSGPPGITGYTTGRPNVREVFAFWPALISKSAVGPEVRFVQSQRST